MRGIRFLSLSVIAMVGSAQHPMGFGGPPAGAFRPGGGLVSPIAVGAAGFTPGAGFVPPPAVGFTPRAGRPPFGVGFHRPGFNSFGRGANLGYPYNPYLGLYPFIGAYGPLGDYGFPHYPGPAEYPPSNNNNMIVRPDTPETSTSSPAAPQTAHPVMNVYKWDESAAPSEQQRLAFTVALKDGSKRDGVTAWVQDRSLHLIDFEGRQQVLAADFIDREMTRRLNRQKNLNLQLPPG